MTKISMMKTAMLAAAALGLAACDSDTNDGPDADTGDGPDAGATGCPGHAEMVRVGSTSWCVDRYESSLWEKKDCTGKLYNVAVDDLPAGFPNQVESTGCAGECEAIVGKNSGEYGEIATLPQTEAVYACSVDGVMPGGEITWFQARRACQNSGKVLCPDDIWLNACSRGGERNYPYGGAPGGAEDDGFDVERCNNVDPEKNPTDGGAKCKTGAHPGCEGGYEGLFDMSGNVMEWTEGCADGQCRLRGGFWGDTRGESFRCEEIQDLDVAFPGSHDESQDKGARCCLSVK